MNSSYRKTIIANLRSKYLFVLGVLSLFSIMSYLFFLYSIKTIDTDGYIINLSGKERFIAQRVALSALQYVSNADPQKKSALQNFFIDRIKELEDAHNFLAHDSVSIIFKHRSPEIESIYFNAPILLDKKITLYINEAHLLAKAQENELTKENTHLQYLLRYSNDLLASLNLIVYQYQKENEKKIETLFYSKTAMFIGLLLAYLFVGIFIFHPMTKKIDRNLIDLENKETELRQINEAHIAAIIDAQERERQRIATDLHDGLIQTLTAAAYKMETAIPEKNFYAIKSLIDDAITETHNIAHNISPPLLKEFGLVPALQSLSEQIKEQSGMSISFQVYDFESLPEYSKLELALYRITQEALHNIQKHAEAKNVKVQLIQHPDSLVLIIEDDGKGFDTSKKQTGKGMGLMSIQERAKAFNGNVIIHSSPNMGTEITVEIPSLINKGKDV